MPEECLEASQSKFSPCYCMWGGYRKANNTHREKKIMGVTCTHWCAMHLSNTASSAPDQPTLNNKNAILTLLPAYPYQHEVSDQERSSHQAWSRCRQKWNRPILTEEVPFKSRSHDLENYPSAYQKQKIASSQHNYYQISECLSSALGARVWFSFVRWRSLVKAYC